jgi:hypothetical protein
MIRPEVGGILEFVPKPDKGPQFTHSKKKITLIEDGKVYEDYDIYYIRSDVKFDKHKQRMLDA